MKVHIISCLKDNYSYIIHDEANDYACVVDPSEANPIIDFIKKKNIKFTNLKKNKNVTKLNAQCWQKLKSMAFETYVPESETSKSGAGY